MNGGVIASIFAAIALIITFFLGSNAGRLKDSKKQNDKLEKEAEAARTEADLAQSAQRSAETKAASEDARSDLAVKIMEVLARRVPEMEKAKNMDTEVDHDIFDYSAAQVTTEPETELLALEIARRQAAQAQSFIEEHK